MKDKYKKDIRFCSKEIDKILEKEDLNVVDVDTLFFFADQICRDLKKIKGE